MTLHSLILVVLFCLILYTTGALTFYAQELILISGLQDCFSWSVVVPVRLIHGNKIAALAQAFYLPPSPFNALTPHSRLPFCHSGTSRTTSSKEEKPSQRSWRGRKKLFRSRPRRKERLLTGPSTLPLHLTACGCACTQSWASCVSTHGLLCVKVLGRHCSPPYQPTGPYCSSQPGILWSGR